MFKLLPILMLQFCFLQAFAYEAHTLYSGESIEKISLEQVVDSVRPGTVVIVSEIHNVQAHHDHQSEFLTALHVKHPEYQVSVGMEFFEYPDQIQVNHYMADLVSEEDFLKDINWGGFSFDFYRSLVQFPKITEGWIVALNAPKWLTSKIGKKGLKSLLPGERAYFPPNFTLGQASYKERFREAMGGGHKLPEELVDNYFAAQSLWDDTMAWQAGLSQQQNPNQVLVIIVGDFHNAYGDGLPARLRARGVDNIMSISQVDLHNLDKSEQDELIVPHRKWGVRADYIWTN